MNRCHLACRLLICGTMFFSAVGFGAFFPAFGSGVFAADIINRVGQEQRDSGEIQEVTKTEVSIMPTGRKEPVVIPANEIESIEWDAAPAGFKLAQSFERGGNLTRALEGYQQALTQADSANELVMAEIEYHIARTIAKGSLANPETQDEAIQKLESFLKSHPDSYNYYGAQNYLGQVYLAKADYVKADVAFATLSNSPFNDLKLAGNAARAKILLQEGKLGEALAAFDAVISAPANGPAELARRYEAMLGKARVQIAQDQQTQALTILDEVIDKSDPRNAALQAEAFLLQGDALRGLERAKEAVLAYLHVDVLFPGQKSEHAESLYHLARLWGTVQEPERAADARAKLESEYPNSAWTQRLAAGGN